MSILLGNGDGTFQPAVNYTISAPPAFAYVAVGDFTGDGKLSNNSLPAPSGYSFVTPGSSLGIRLGPDDPGALR